MSGRRTSSFAAAQPAAATGLAALGLVALGLAALGLAVAAAGPAFAKSSLALRVSAREVAPGERIGLTARGASDDFGGAPVRLCVDERAGQGSWRVVRCGGEGELRLTVRTARPGTLSFRSQLLAGIGHGRFVVDRSSPTVTVHVR